MGPDRWWKDWRWLLRRDCRAITNATALPGEFRITLCRRWRWHSGPCAPKEAQ